MVDKKFIRRLYYWNRKVHIYLGLFLLLFLWLFSFTGLLLNHRSWLASDFWPKREENKVIVPVNIPESRESAMIVNSVLSQTGTEGEVSNVKMWADSIQFNVAIPGKVWMMNVDFGTGRCIQKILKYNWSGKLQTLHTYNGGDAEKASIREWILIPLWRLSMDGIAIGLILLCISSWVLYFRSDKNPILKWVILAAGFICAGYFVFI